MLGWDEVKRKACIAKLLMLQNRTPDAEFELQSCINHK